VAERLELISRSEADTVRIGRALGETLRGGEVIELCGPLGSGKTRLAKGLALGLGVADDEEVISPTFVLVREYVGRLRFYHCDAYRLRSAAELHALGVEEMLEGGGSVVAVEWADRFPLELSGPRYRVGRAHRGRNPRRITVGAPDEQRAGELRSRLAAPAPDPTG